MARHARGQGRHRAPTPPRRPGRLLWALAVGAVLAALWVQPWSGQPASLPPVAAEAPATTATTTSPPVSRNVPTTGAITAVVPVRYENCAEAPGRLTRMMAGYATWLDPDGDGVACEGK